MILSGTFRFTFSLGFYSKIPVALRIVRVNNTNCTITINTVCTWAKCTPRNNRVMSKFQTKIRIAHFLVITDNKSILLFYCIYFVLSSNNRRLSRVGYLQTAFVINFIIIYNNKTSFITLKALLHTVSCVYTALVENLRTKTTNFISYPKCKLQIFQKQCCTQVMNTKNKNEFAKYSSENPNLNDLHLPPYHQTLSPVLKKYSLYFLLTSSLPVTISPLETFTNVPICSLVFCALSSSFQNISFSLKLTNICSS